MAGRNVSSRSRLPECGYTFDGVTCRKRGDHHCRLRVSHVAAFFAEVLVHTKGRWARRPFVLAAWQRKDIISPVFGTVRWDVETKQYVRRYRIVWIEIGRKNGKSELLAGIMLYLLVADGEEGAELYGCAKDREQAGKVYDVAERMVILSPVLSSRLKVYRQSKRIVDESSGSYYQIIASDASGNLGHNPHGVAFDEVISQPNGDLWDALESAMGARTQPLMVAATTAGNDPAGFAATVHAEMERIAEDPRRDPRAFVYIRNVPLDATWHNEKLWKLGNPALGDFLSRQVLRDEAHAARNEPRKENAFRQYRLNQWVRQQTRWLNLDIWNDNVGDVAANPEWFMPELTGKRCWAGLDLSSKLDLTAWTLLFDDGTVLWRFWCPESLVPRLNKDTGGRFELWARDGWVTLTEGDVIDYEQVYADIELDHSRYAIESVTYDRWSGEPVRQQIEERTGLAMIESGTTYERMTLPMTETMRLLTSRELRHGGNPVATWMADAVEAKSPRDDPDRIRPVKPDRAKSGKRIDGMVTLILAVDGRLTVVEKETEKPAPFALFGGSA